VRSSLRASQGANSRCGNRWRLPVRSLSILLVPLLAACEYVYGVERSVVVPGDYDSTPIHRILGQEPGYAQFESEVGSESSALSMIRDGDAIAAVCCEDGRLIVSSCWIGSPPSPVVLDESLGLQEELIRIIRTVDQRLPIGSEWSIEWTDSSGRCSSRWVPMPLGSK
jgi:hypothetical protein